MESQLVFPVLKSPLGYLYISYSEYALFYHNAYTLGFFGNLRGGGHSG